MERRVTMSQTAARNLEDTNQQKKAPIENVTHPSPKPLKLLLVALTRISKIFRSHSYTPF
jgi:hypothetical protein